MRKRTLSMVIAMIVVGIRPIAFNKHIAVIMFFPLWCHPDIPTSGWKFPVARNPFMAPVPAGPVSADPNVVARWTISLNDDFMTGRRRSAEVDVNVNGRDQVCGGQRCRVRRKGSKRAEGDQYRRAKLNGAF